MATKAAKLAALRSLASRRSGFNPGQPRDENGQWTRSRGSGAPAAGSATKRKSSNAAVLEPVRTVAEMPEVEALQKARLKSLSVANPDGKNAARIYTAKIDGRHYFLKGVDSSRDAAAEGAVSDIAQAVGLEDSVLPVRNFKRKLVGWGEVDCIATPMLSGADMEALGDGELSKKLDDATAARFLLFDYAIGMADRHAGNVFQQDDGKLRLIDHESAFHRHTEPDPYSVFYAHFDSNYLDTAEAPGRMPNRVAGRELDREFAQRLVDSEEVMISAIRARFGPKCKNAVEGVQARLNVLRNLLNKNNLTIGGLYG